MMGFEMMLKNMVGEETLQEIEALKKEAPKFVAEAKAYTQRMEEKLDYIMRVQAQLIAALEKSGTIERMPRVGDTEDGPRLPN